MALVDICIFQVHRVFGSMTEREQDTTLVAVPTAEGDGTTTTVDENSSGTRKRKRISAYNFHCPCDVCEGGAPIPYGTVNRHIKTFLKRISININNQAAGETRMAKLLKYNDNVLRELILQVSAVVTQPSPIVNPDDSYEQSLED